jgi:PAS domain S-box-containing protein
LFATDTRRPDALLIEGTSGLASQFARMIERSAADEAHAKLAAIVENSYDAIIGRAVDARITTWNAAAERILGYTAAEAIGREMTEIHPPELRDEIVEWRKRLLAGRPGGSGEQPRIAKDGRRIDMAISVSAIKDKGGRIVGTAAILRDITERKQAEQALHDYARRLQGLSRRLVAVGEVERRKINRELHDRIGQNIAALNINLNIIRSQLPPESLRTVSAHLQKTQTLLEETAAHARNVMADLHPPALDDYGLLAALRSYVESFGARVAVPITVQGEDLAPRLSSAAEMALFRVAQGAIANAVQHARAKRIEVLLAATPERVTLAIADDGAGFDPKHVVPAHTSWGLTIMQERAEAVGARLTVESAPGKGTRVRVEIDRLTGSKPAMNCEEYGFEQNQNA